MAGETIQYKLHKNYENFTGLLNGVYPVRNGIATLPEGAEKKGGKVLRDHYGAVKIEPKSAEVKAEDKKEEKKA